VEDVSGYLAAKVAALVKHHSQLSEGIRFFADFLGKDAVEAGGNGVEHAEEFRVLDLSSATSRPRRSRPGSR
jgi:hypothetical protein